MSGFAYLRNHASEEDHRIGQELKKVDLFFELNFDEDAVGRAQELFGRIAHAELRTREPKAVIKRYPALTLASLIGTAGIAYEQGRYWEAFWDAVGLDPHDDFAAELRHQLHTLLRRFELREFPEVFAKKTYVMALALHAGIPVHCVGDLIDVIDEHVHRGRDASGAALLEWLTEPGLEYRLNRLDVPVRNFLQLAGGLAVDILDRIIEFLMFTLEHPEPWNDLTLDTGTTGLPTLLLDGLIDRLRERPFGQVADRRPPQKRSRKPTIGYSVSDDQVMIAIPYPEAAATIPWKVAFAGSSRLVYAERGWGAGRDEEQPPTLVAVNAPAREVVLIHEASGEKHRVGIFDSSDPLLLFTLEGRLVRRHSPLPRGVVISLRPKDATLVDAVTGAAVEEVGEARGPTGWTGWVAQGVDLNGHDSVLLRRPGRPEGAIRGVRSVGSPRIELPDAVLGLHLPNGLAVYNERPTMVLPPHVGPKPVVWRVRARKEGERSWLVEEEWVSTTEDCALDPFDGVEPGLLGRYEIRVGSASAGSDLLYSLFMAEGVELDHGGDFRLPVPGGLSPSVTTVSSDGALTADKESITFETEDREGELRLSRGATAYKAVVCPPAFESRIDPIGAPAQWRTSVQVIAPGDLAQHATIAARIPGEVAASFALVDGSGTVVQEETPELSADNVFQMSSTRFVDTALRLGGCTLAALVDDSAGATHRVPIANVRPANLCDRVDLDGDDLVFAGLANENEIAAWVWTATAPWRPVERLQIAGDRAKLPDEMRGAGDLIVEVFVDDPWVTITRPNRPGPASQRVVQLGWVRDDDAAWDALSSFLAGNLGGRIFESTVSGAWSALATLRWDATDPESERIRGGLIRMICRNPRSALEALGNSTIDHSDSMALLIRTELIDYAYSASFTLNELHPDPWVGCLVEISDLPSLLERKANVQGEREETLGYLQNQGGEALIELLRAGRMTDPRVGIFGANAQAIDAKTAEQIDEIFEASELVPGAVLDVDTRTSATAAAFRLRNEWAHDPACTQLAGHVSYALRQIKQDAPLVYDLVSARNEALAGAATAERPWMLLSMQSLALAAVARLWAHGELARSPMTREMRNAWARMAEYFPAMVAGDLLIADAMASYLSHGNLIGEPA